MKHKRLAIEEILYLLGRADLGAPIDELIREAGISARTLSQWKKMRTALESEQRRRVTKVAEENRRLKRIICVRRSQ